MARCRNISPRRRKLCSGDMTFAITIQTRTLKGSSFGVGGHTIDFTDDTPVRAAIQTLKPGTTIFDGSNDRPASHDFFINHIDFPGITAENWVLYDGRRFDILNVEPIDERKRFIRLRCNERGTDANAVNSQ